MDYTYWEEDKAIAEEMKKKYGNKLFKFSKETYDKPVQVVGHTRKRKK